MVERIMILGPTASGKSALALRLATALDAEILSVDSRQCYRMLDIGTAKPSPEELEEVPHYNISILDPDERDSVADFHPRAEKWIGEIHSRGKRVICVGGSTLHLQSLIRPPDPAPGSNEKHLEHLAERAEREGLKILWEELRKVDPRYAEQMDGLNRQRIFRALDVWMQSNRPFSSFHTGSELQPPEEMRVYGLHWPRPDLHRRIEERAARMLREGLIQETQSILGAGYEADLQSLQTVGYREAISHLNGRMGRGEMLEKIQTSTRRYARRQLTWFRRWPFIHWMAGTEDPSELVAEIVKDLS
ncbi:MAG: tRNA (adenosine(37)-N6)-dimethylallyltransferase MiaA [Balneolaceae bacterium]